MSHRSRPTLAMSDPASSHPSESRLGLKVAVIVVSYRTPGDVASCLDALRRLPSPSAFDVFVCENGGTEAWEKLLVAIAGSYRPVEQRSVCPDRFTRVAAYELWPGLRGLMVGEACENLGYSGGVNAWLLPLLRLRNYGAFWILNPDALPSPNSLAALMTSAEHRGLEMVGSRIMTNPPGDNVRSMGLRWRQFRANTQAVGCGTAVQTDQSPEVLDRLIDAPSGASVLLTRQCAEALAPLDERYFLYYEDLDWGVRAKLLGLRVGYAHDSVVVHEGGRSLGSASAGSETSELAVYLEHRNRLLFVARHFRGWWAWTVTVSWLRAFRLLGRRSFLPACQGIVAGMRLEVGRPDRLLARHRTSGES